jgi:hypothetical protein
MAVATYPINVDPSSDKVATPPDIKGDGIVKDGVARIISLTADIHGDRRHVWRGGNRGDD